MCRVSHFPEAEPGKSAPKVLGRVGVDDGRSLVEFLDQRDSELFDGVDKWLVRGAAFCCSMYKCYESKVTV